MRLEKLPGVFNFSGENIGETGGETRNSGSSTRFSFEGFEFRRIRTLSLEVPLSSLFEGYLSYGLQKL